MEHSLALIGPLILVAVGLFVYLVLVWLQYQHDASVLDAREAQLHQHIQANLLVSEQSRARTAQTLERCRALEQELPGLHQQLTQLREAGSGNQE